MPSPAAKPDLSAAIVLDHGWRVVLHNDDVTPFDVVILGLQKTCGVSEEVAEMIAIEAHESGSATARGGLTQDDAEMLCIKLKAATRIPRVCPGVACTAERE